MRDSAYLFSFAQSAAVDAYYGWQLFRVVFAIPLQF
jgi:hypothetical protein